MDMKIARRRRPPASKAKRAGRRSRAHDFIIFKIGILRRLIERYANPWITEGHDMTVAEWRILTHLFSASPMTATELSGRLCTDKAEVSRACSSLIANGHVSSNPDPDDRRSTFLAITRSGEQLHDRILPLRQALQDELAARLTASENRTLHKALNKLIEHLSVRLADGGAEISPPPARTPARRKRPAPARRPK
jgi:DNA-binding MarR family transcriptional regulator